MWNQLQRHQRSVVFFTIFLMYIIIINKFSRVSFSNGSGREKEKKRNVEKSERRKKDLAKENRDLR